MDLTKYVLVPYEEYQELISKRQKDNKSKIFLEPLKDYVNRMEISVRTYNLLIDIMRGKFILTKKSKIALKKACPYGPTDVIKRFNKFQFVGDLVSKSDYDFLSLSGFGRNGLNELKAELKRNNLYLNSNLSEDIKNKLEELTNPNNKESK